MQSAYISVESFRNVALPPSTRTRAPSERKGEEYLICRGALELFLKHEPARFLFLHIVASQEKPTASDLELHISESQNSYVLSRHFGQISLVFTIHHHLVYFKLFLFTLRKIKLHICKHGCYVDRWMIAPICSICPCWPAFLHLYPHSIPCCHTITAASKHLL